MGATVLNGEVKAGDTIAYATRSGSCQDMHIATVLEVAEKPHAWKTDETISVLKVEVTESTWTWSGLPRKATIGVLERVVKLSQ